MNANFGIVLRKIDRESILSPVAPRVRTWGDEVLEEESPRRYTFPQLAGVEFEIYPITDFICSRLPSSERAAELEYAWMTGTELDLYEQWIIEQDDTAPLSAFELALIALLDQLSFWSVMLAPEGERLGSFVTVSTIEVVHLLRGCVRNLAGCDGFLAIVQDRTRGVMKND